MLSQVIMQETDISGFDVWTWGLPFPVRKEIWKNVDFPLGPPIGEDVLNILLEPQRNIQTVIRGGNFEKFYPISSMFGVRISESLMVPRGQLLIIAIISCSTQ